MSGSGFMCAVRRINSPLPRIPRKPIHSRIDIDDSPCLPRRIVRQYAASPARVSAIAPTRPIVLNYRLRIHLGQRSHTMAEKDIVSKQLLRRLLVDIAEYLLGLSLREAELMETEQQRVEDRRSDLTARVVDAQGARYVLHLEIQDANHPRMPDRMLRYLSDIRLAHPGETVYQYLLYIGRDPLTMADGLDTPQLRYHYPVIDMHRLDYRQLLAQNSPDAVVLAILGDFRGQPPQQVVRELLERLIQLTGGAGQPLRDYLLMLEVLAQNRDLAPLVREVYQMLHVELERLPSYCLGLEQGQAKGRLEGRQEGWQEGRQEGRQEAARAVAQRLLARGMSPEDVADITGLPFAEVARLRT